MYGGLQQYSQTSAADICLVFCRRELVTDAISTLIKSAGF
jgi:hypothetical protein